MKVLRTILFLLGCFLVFLVSGAISCALRAKYRTTPLWRSSSAYMYVAVLDRFAFLQYNQANPQQGKAALLKYLKLMQRIRNEQIRFPEDTLHYNSGLTYLRLYRLESSVGDLPAADAAIRSAQEEVHFLGWKDVSREFLQKNIETREATEAMLDTKAGLRGPETKEKPATARENSQ